MIFNLLFLTFSLLSFYLGSPPVMAQDMNSENYILQGGNFNIAGGNKSSSGYRLIDLVGQTSAQVFSSKGYLIQSGFNNRAAGSSLIFSISPLGVNFPSLVPNLPQTRDLLITVKSGNFPGFAVYLAEDKQLSSETNAVIPDTVCNAAKDAPCNKDSAGLWNLSDSYGFGYQLEGKKIPEDFKKPGFFRPFASLNKNELASLIMETAEQNSEQNARMILKINVSRTQPVGIYSNNLNFTALPGI